jgi:hypothetical protein
VVEAVERRQLATARAVEAAIEIDPKALAELLERVDISLRNFEVNEALLAGLILITKDELAGASMLIRHQHERVDGLGFPVASPAMLSRSA